MLFEQYRSIIPSFGEFLEILQTPLAVYLRANPRRISAHALRAALEGAGVRVETVPWYEDALRVEGLDRPGATLEWYCGWYHLQGLTSMVPPLALEVCPGDAVLDLCAAPGSKATQLCALAGDRGFVIANEPYLDRVSILKSHVERLGFTNACLTAVRGDAFPGGLCFDRVLLDTPCSGEGTERVRPDETVESAAARFALDRTRRRSDLARLYRLQRNLLRRAGNLVKPGGLLVYSTCTYDPRENELLLAEVLGERPDLELEPIPSELGGEPGLTRWEGRELPAALAHTRRFYPHRAGNSWGFFCARIRKVGVGRRRGRLAQEAAREAAQEAAQADARSPDRDLEAEPLPACVESCAEGVEACAEGVEACAEGVVPPGTDPDARVHALLAPYAVAPAAFSGHRTLRFGRGHWLVAASLPDPARLSLCRPQNPGLRLFRLDERVPKLATFGAIQLGPHLRARVVDLRPDEVRAFIQGEPIERAFPEVDPLRGYAVARVGQQVIGAGLFRRGAFCGEVPKRFRRIVRRSFAIAPGAL